MGRRSRRERRPCSPESSARGSSSRPASVKRVAANSIGGTLSTTSFTAVKLVPKKKTVSRSEASTRGEPRRFSFVTLADEVRVRTKSLDVDGDQTRAVLKIVELHHLVRRVHVAVGRRDEPRGDAGAGELDRVCVRPRRARVGLQRVGDPRLLGCGDEGVGDYRTQVGGPLYDRAATEGVVAVLVLGDAGCVGRVGHVDGYGGVGVQSEGSAAGAVEPDLLLHARHSDDFRIDAFLLGEQPQGLEHDEGAHPVVQRAGGDAVVGELEQVLVYYPRVADPDHPFSLVCVLRAYIYPQALYVRDLLAFLGFHEVDSLLADHTHYLAALRLEAHPLADEHLRVPAANPAEAHEPLLVDVGDYHADLIYVPG